MVAAFGAVSTDLEADKVRVFGLFWAKSFSVETALEESSFNSPLQTAATSEYSSGKEFGNPLKLDCGLCGGEETEELICCFCFRSRLFCLKKDSVPVV